jgi:predicted TIM-barrel fold metal-dependent hydrolase
MSTHEVPQIFLQSHSTSELFLSLCDEQGIDHAYIMERHALDGDPYNITLAVAATAQALAAVGLIVKALLNARNPIKLAITTVDANGKRTETHVAGVSRADFPAVEALLRATQGRASTATER